MFSLPILAARSTHAHKELAALGLGSDNPISNDFRDGTTFSEFKSKKMVEHNLYIEIGNR